MCKSSYKVLAAVCAVGLVYFSVCAVYACSVYEMAKSADEQCERTIEKAAEPTQEVQATEEEQVKYFDCPLSHELQDCVFSECSAYEVEPELMLAIMEKESKFHADEISATNDYGLMQINACHKSWLKSSYGINNLLDPKQNIKAGAIMLGNLSRSYSSIEAIAMAYNLGEGGAKAAFKKGIYSTAYSRAVYAKYQAYKEA